MNINFNFFGFLRSTFSEADGSGSCSRVLIASIVAFVLGAGTALVFKLHTPVTVTDVDGFLAAAGIFIATTCTPLYLINKGAGSLNKRSDNDKEIAMTAIPTSGA